MESQEIKVNVNDIEYIESKPRISIPDEEMAMELRRVMIEFGLTKKQVADRIGRSEFYVRHILNKYRKDK